MHLMAADLFSTLVHIMCISLFMASMPRMIEFLRVVLKAGRWYLCSISIIEQSSTMSMSCLNNGVVNILRHLNETPAQPSMLLANGFITNARNMSRIGEFTSVSWFLIPQKPLSSRRNAFFTFFMTSDSASAVSLSRSGIGMYLLSSIMFTVTNDGREFIWIGIPHR